MKQDEQILTAKLADDLTREERIKRFKEEFREAAESYNCFIAEHGLWGQEYRKW
jgi:post-segregation antitoxin (ccd killing protein)